MPIMDKMNRNNEPDDFGGGFGNDDDIKQEKRRPQPEFIESHQGARQISVGALLERIAAQFNAEQFPDPQAIVEAKTKAARLKLLLPVVDYVLTVESITLEDAEKADLMRKAYSAMFGYGPLDPFLEDPTVTTIVLEGADSASIRYGHGDLVPCDPLLFEDIIAMRAIVDRMVLHASAEIREDVPIIEAGLTYEGRPLSLNIAAPPVNMNLSVDIRVHAAQPVSLESMLETGEVDEKSIRLLRALINSEHGFAVVGQPESGKTVLLGALLNECEAPENIAVVERASEMHLPAAMPRFPVQWPRGDFEGVTFGEQLREVLLGETDYDTLVLDEVRADEPHFIQPLLAKDEEAIPRLIWSFRGAPDSKRLISALGMLARSADTSQAELMVRRVFERLPYVVSLLRASETIVLSDVGEWVLPEDGNYPEYRQLLKTTLGEISLTGEKPTRPLPGLDDSFWSS